MVIEILQKADKFKNYVEYLKSVAPDYPKVHEEASLDGAHWATTMVKFTYNGVEYKRHHVESIMPTKDVACSKMIERLNHNAELCIKHAIPCQYDTVIGVIKP